jgi:hypothetical protein
MAITEAFLRLNLAEALTTAEGEQLIAIAQREDKTLERVLFEAAKEKLARERVKPTQEDAA